VLPRPLQVYRTRIHAGGIGLVIALGFSRDYQNGGFGRCCPDISLLKRQDSS